MFSNFETLAIVLGPLQNCTTLLAAILAFHPHCQVLHHGFEEIRLGWMANGSDEDFRSSVEYAVGLSKEPTKGASQGGGSILESHAFEDSGAEVDLLEEYRERYGNRRIKKRIDCLLWKDPIKFTGLLRRKHSSLSQIFENFPEIRLLLPMRNLIDTFYCTWEKRPSFVRTHYGFKPPLNKKDLIGYIVSDVAWVLRQSEAYPGRFHVFFWEDYDRELLIELSKFLRLKEDRKWLKDCLTCFKVRTRDHDYDLDFVDHYEHLIRSSDFGKWEDKFLGYADEIRIKVNVRR